MSSGLSDPLDAALRRELEIARSRTSDRSVLLTRLAEAEQELAELPGLRLDVAELRKLIGPLQARIDELERERLDLVPRAARTERAEATLHDVTGSPSWRMTAPLRRVMRLIRG